MKNKQPNPNKSGLKDRLVSVMHKLKDEARERLQGQKHIDKEEAMAGLAVGQVFRFPGSGSSYRVFASGAVVNVDKIARKAEKRAKRIKARERNRRNRGIGRIGPMRELGVWAKGRPLSPVAQGAAALVGVALAAGGFLAGPDGGEKSEDERDGEDPNQNGVVSHGGEANAS